MHKQSQNWSGVQYPLNAKKLEFVTNFKYDYNQLSIIDLHFMSIFETDVSETWINSDSNNIDISCIDKGTR